MTENNTVDSDDVSKGSASISAARIAAQGPTEVPFAQKLMNMINDGRFRGVLGWSADGASFSILKRDVFKRRVLPAYFGSIQVKSFKKRLSRHGFETRQIYTLGREDTAFFHPNFRRDQPELCVLIVPMGTSRSTKKRSRGDVEDQPFDRLSSSWPRLPPNGANSTEDGHQPLEHSPSQPPPPPPLPAVFPTPNSIEKRSERSSPPSEEVKVATALLDVSRKTTAISDDRSWSAPSVKKMRLAHSSSATQGMSMGAQLAGTSSDALSIEACDKGQARDEGTATNPHESETHREASPPCEDGDGELESPTLPKVLSFSPTASRAPEPISADECRTMPYTASGSCIEDSDPKDEGPSVSRDNGMQTETGTGRSQEKGATEKGAGSIEQPANGCVWIDPKANDAGCLDVPSSAAQCVLQQEENGRSPLSATQSSSIGVNSSFLHTIQQQWLQSELQAAAMSAQAAFLRNLYVQACGSHGILSSLGGAFPSHTQPRCLETLQQQLQMALGSMGRDGCGVPQHGTQIGGPPVVLPEGRQQQLWPHPRPQTNSAQSTTQHRTSTLLSPAQDPVAVILEMASSLGQKSSS